MILASFYKAIIAALYIPETGIKYIERYKGQLEAENDSLPFNKPAILVEFEPFQWQILGRRRRSATLNFTLYVMSDQVYLETSTTESEAERNAGLIHLDIIDVVNKKMQGLNGALPEGSFGSIVPGAETPDIEYGNTTITQLQFITRIVDDSGKYATTNQAVTQEITTCIK